MLSCTGWVHCQPLARHAIGFRSVHNGSSVRTNDGLSTEQFPVSAYTGSSKNLNDLKDLPPLAQSDGGIVPASEHRARLGTVASASSPTEDWLPQILRPKTVGGGGVGSSHGGRGGWESTGEREREIGGWWQGAGGGWGGGGWRVQG